MGWGRCGQWRNHRGQRDSSCDGPPGHQPCPPAGPQFPHPRPEAKERKLENTNLGQLQIRLQVI